MGVAGLAAAMALPGVASGAVARSATAAAAAAPASRTPAPAAHPERLRGRDAGPDAPGDVLSSFPVPGGIGYDVDWDEEDGTLWIVSDGFTPGEPLLFNVTADGALLRSFVLPNAGTGNGIAVVGSLLYVADFQGDLVDFDDNVMAIDKATGELVAFWAVDDGTCATCVPNPNPDDAVDELIGIAHVEGDTFYLTTFADATVRRVELVIDAPPSASSSWQTVDRFTNGSGDPLTGIDVGPVYGAAGSTSVAGEIHRFDAAFEVVESFAAPGEFAGGVTERSSDGHLFHVDVSTNLVYELAGFPVLVPGVECQGAVAPLDVLPYRASITNVAPLSVELAFQLAVLRPSQTLVPLLSGALTLGPLDAVGTSRGLGIPTSADPGDYAVVLTLQDADLTELIGEDSCPFRVLPAGWLECAADDGSFDDLPFNVQSPVGPEDYFAVRLDCAGIERPFTIREIAVFSEDLVPFTPGEPPFTRAGVAPPDLVLDASGRTPDLDAAVAEVSPFPLCELTDGCFVNVPVEASWTAAEDPVVFVQFPAGDPGSMGVGGDPTAPFGSSVFTADGFQSPGVQAQRNWGIRLVVDTVSGERLELGAGGAGGRVDAR